MYLSNKLIHDIKKILTHYGNESQKNHTIEELDELSIEIKFGDRDNVKEELADVYVMLEQVKAMYHLTDLEIVEVMKYKVKRQHDRISKEDKTNNNLCLNKKKVYLAGSITHNHNYIKEFTDAETKLKKLGYKVFNPVREAGYKYKDYIDVGLRQLMRCDAIYLQKNWQQSKGACLEKKYAECVGLEIMYEEKRSFK